MTTISFTIRELRKKAGFTQAQVSRILNIQRQTYCNYENASRTPPLEIIISLSDLYKVSIDYLVRGKSFNPSRGSAQPADPSEQKLLNIYGALSDDAKKEVLSFAQFKKNYE